MRHILFIVSTLFFFSFIGEALSAGCVSEKDRLLHILQEGMSRIRVREEQTDASQILSPETKSDYLQNAQWVLAWTSDHVERLKENIAESGTVREGIACGDLADFRKNVEVQWLPLAKKEQEMAVTRILWDLDVFVQTVSHADAADSLAKARDFFLQANDAQSRSEWRILLRKGAFHVRLALRLLKNL